MSEKEKLSCEICKKEIPASVAVTMEGRAYVFHFCSPDCRDHYFQKHPELRLEDFQEKCR